MFLRGRTSWVTILFSFFKIELNIEDNPNNPVNRANRGCFIGRLSVAIPKKPDKRNMKIAFHFEVFSKYIRKKIVIRIRRESIFWVYGNTRGRIKKKIGDRRIKSNNPPRAP